METVNLAGEVETLRLGGNGRLRLEATGPETEDAHSSHGMASRDLSTAAPRTLDPLPSRSLELKPILSSAAEMEVRETLRKEWQLDAVEHSYVDKCSTVRFYDLRESKAAWERFNNSILDGSTISATFSNKVSARDYDEEGRIVVQVGDHLNLDQLIHVFSTYGAVRNIQDVPNINVYKVVEFYDIRDAQKATKALNLVQDNSFIVSSVACMSKARTQRMLIPPRVSSELEPLFEEHSRVKMEKSCSFMLQEKKQSRSPEKPEEMTRVSFGGLIRRASSTAFGAHSLPDSSSSLTSVTDQEDFETSLLHSTENDTPLVFQQSHLKQKNHSQLFSFPENRVFSDLRSGSEDLGELSLEDVLPAGLGLYNDEPSQQEGTKSYSTSSGLNAMHAMDHQQPGTGVYSPYTSNDIAQLYLSKRLANQQLMNNALLARLMGSTPSGVPLANAQGLLGGFNPGSVNTLSVASYFDELKQMTLLQQVVNLEVLKRLNALKAFDHNGLRQPAPSMFPFPRSEEALRKMEKANRRKQSRANRKKTVVDLQEEAEKRAEQEKLFALDLERVKTREDKRTTLMIKNIPNKYTQQLLLTRIEESFKGTFDFFYLPIDFKNKCNVGYGFINMTKLEYIAPFVQHVHEQKWDKFNSDKVCCVTYARIQGLSALISHFQNSSLMFEESKHQPLIFDANGDPEPFPEKPAS